MNRILILGLVILSLLGLVSCASHRSVGFNPAYTHESWMSQLPVSPMPWTLGADRWFVTGDPNATELQNRAAPYSVAMSTVNVKVPDFTNVKIVGNFEVQIFGTYNPNTVYVYGPNDAIRQVSVKISGNTLCVTQLNNARISMQHVIVRIGMNNLMSLMHTGCSRVEGINIRSAGLYVTANGTGNIYLAGDLPIRRIAQNGIGSVNIFGANTSCLDVVANNNGQVNISGPHVGLRSIVHHAFGSIRVIGASSAGLKINADGGGRVLLNGNNINLNSLTVTDKVQVYANGINSGTLYVHTYQNARVGLRGSASDMYADAQDNSVIYGRDLCVINGYIRTSSCAHINVGAGRKIFASATQDSSIYFYGSPDMMSQFVSGGAVVIPIWSNSTRSCMVTYPMLGKRVPRGGYKGEV